MEKYQTENLYHHFDDSLEDIFPEVKNLSKTRSLLPQFCKNASEVASCPREEWMNARKGREHTGKVQQQIFTQRVSSYLIKDHSYPLNFPANPMLSLE